MIARTNRFQNATRLPLRGASGQVLRVRWRSHVEAHVPVLPQATVLTLGVVAMDAPKMALSPLSSPRGL